MVLCFLGGRGSGEGSREESTRSSLSDLHASRIVGFVNVDAVELCCVIEPSTAASVIAWRQRGEGWAGGGEGYS